MSKSQEVRFWAFMHGGHVRIKLPGDKELHHFWASEDDEGWSSESTTFSYDEDRNAIVMEWLNQGRDCDGRVQFGGEMICAITDINAGQSVDGISFPKWEWIERWQRDDSAEAMGY